MKNVQDINSIDELLNSMKAKQHPVLVNICPKCENDNFLMDEIVKRIISKSETYIEYLKFDYVAAIKIKEDLKLTKNPVFLLIIEGKIKDVFSGTIGYQRMNHGIQLATKGSELGSNIVTLPIQHRRQKSYTK